ncbi:hypothetical protein K438DRAFT_1946835 [Mycena galopus ATCC 62051]|nr:hypothetical protein K438DRAFT_1946835 [Mycena galopus ATCC 62051]
MGNSSSSNSWSDSSSNSTPITLDSSGLEACDIDSGSDSRGGKPSDDLNEKSRAIYVVSHSLCSKGAHATVGEDLEKGETAPPRTCSHWAVRVEDAVYELQVGNKNTIRYLHGAFVESSWENCFYVGETLFMNKQLEDAGQSLLNQMPREYDALFNSCHTFVVDFLPLIALGDITAKLKQLVTGVRLVQATINITLFGPNWVPPRRCRLRTDAQ